MAILHLQCPSGLAGDMFLGACIDLGLPIEAIQEAVAVLGLEGITVEARRARRGGVTGIRFRVLADGLPIEGPDPEEEPGPAAPKRARPGRNLALLRQLIGSSGLPATVRERAVALFVRLAEVEAGIHGVGIDEVHFHEVGAVDSIVDLVGAVVALETLKPERLTCSTVVVGSGTVATEHGVLPVPAPATAELLRGLPVRGEGEGELVTPTGALILAELVDEFVELPPMRLLRGGYGLGRRDPRSRPNACRLLEGEPLAGAAPEVMVVECQIDDLPGEGFGFLIERLLEEGALDVYFTPVQMKKSRPGVLVTMLCRPAELERLAGLLLAESGSFGCRYQRAQRFEAERDVRTVETEFGAVRIKRARFEGRILAESPEYEDVRRLAEERRVAWRSVYAAAVRAAATATE